MSASQIALGVVIGGVVSSSFGSSLKNVTSSLSDFESKIKKLSSEKISLKAQNDPANAMAISKINQELLSLRKSAKIKIALEGKKEELLAQRNSLLGVLGTAYILSTPIKAQMEIEQSQGEIASLGIDTKGIEAITQAGKKFSSEFAGTTTSDFIKASYDIKSGISSLSNEGVAEFTRLSAMTATATKSTTQEMTKLFALGYGIYGEQFKDDFEFGNKFSAAISKSVQAFRTDGSDLSSGLSTLGATATKMGVSLEEQLSVIGNAKGAFNSASEAATSYRAFLGSVGKAQEKLGISMTDSSGKMLPMNEILGKLKNSMGDLSEVKNMDTLKEAFGSDEAVKIITALIDKNGDLLKSQKEISEAMNEGTTITKKMADAMQKGQGFTLLSQQIGNLGATIGTIFMPAATLLASTIGGIVSVLGSAIERFPVVSSVIGGVVMGMFALVAVTKLATVTKTLFSIAYLTSKGILLGMPMVLGVLKIGYFALGGAMKFAGNGALWLGRALLMNPIGLAVAAIAGAVYLIYSNWEPIKMWFLNLWDGVKNIFNSALNDIQTVLSFSPLGLIVGAWGGIFEWFGSKFAFVTQGIETLKSAGASIAGFFGFGGDEKKDEKKQPSKVVTTLKNTTLAVATVGTLAATPNKAVVPPKINQAGTTYKQQVQTTKQNLSNTRNTTNTTAVSNKKDGGSIVINIHNPKITSKEEMKKMEIDIKKAVTIALKEKEQSGKNRAYKDVV